MGMLLLLIVGLLIPLVYVAAAAWRLSETDHGRRRLVAMARRLDGRPDAGEGRLADLQGAAEISAARGRRMAWGLLTSAARARARRMVGGVWTPVDWVLASSSRAQAAIAAAVGAQAVYIDIRLGLDALLTDGWGWCGSCGLALMGLAAWLRRVRGIEVAARQRPSGDE
ncbi:hypothetical protein [Streptomyces sp. NPDC049040]|uniref:hypothetical protein n=1 Tax=Streptomyces sp. NPDC049040 TaxID=3365593 RepID=UPI0037213E5E